MKLKIRNRILIALAGLVLMGAAACACIEIFGGTDVYAVFLAKLVAPLGLQPGTILYVILGLLPVAVAALLGIYCVSMLFRKLRRVSEIRISGANGDLTINASVLENLVNKCMKSYDEIDVLKTRLTESRDGVNINMQLSVANGVNIPMIKEEIQKQIKKYVLNCSGVDVHNVNLDVQKLSTNKTTGKYSVPEEKPKEKTTFGTMKQQETAPVQTAPAAAEKAPEIAIEKAEEAKSEEKTTETEQND